MKARGSAVIVLGITSTRLNLDRRKCHTYVTYARKPSETKLSTSFISIERPCKWPQHIPFWVSTCSGLSALICCFTQELGMKDKCMRLGLASTMCNTCAPVMQWDKRIQYRIIYAPNLCNMVAVFSSHNLFNSLYIKRRCIIISIYMIILNCGYDFSLLLEKHIQDIQKV